MLLIDCGNTAAKCRYIEGDKVADAMFKLADAGDRSSLIAFIQQHPGEHVYLASVASKQNTERLLRLLRTAGGVVEITQLETLPSLGGVTNAYEQYDQLGVDRWLTLLAADQRQSGDSMIIDAGSAITIDLLSKHHGHLGGAILPGFKTSRERFIGMFPAVDFNHPAIQYHQQPGRSTAACIQLQQIPVTVQTVEQLVFRWLPLLQEPVSILLCGQDSPRISRGLSLQHEVVADLVFQGMLQQIQLQG